jgi:hypothetical protein
MSDAAITKDLPYLKWRGLLAPGYDILPFRWRNRLAARQYPYVDVDAHDPTGRDSFQGLSARLYFVNTVDHSFDGLGRLFPDYWETWRDQLLDGAAGDLEHPVLGPIRARVAEGSGVVESKVRSGILVDVTWVETNEDPSTLELLGNIAADPARLAAAADAGAAAFGVQVAPGRLPVMFATQYGLSFPSGFAPPTLVDLYAAIRAPLFAGVLGAADQLLTLMGDVAAMVDALMALDDVMTWPALDACRAFWAAINTQRVNLARASRKLGRVVLDRRKTLDVFAREHKNSVAEIMALNAQALRGPYADRGTTLYYYLPN